MNFATTHLKANLVRGFSATVLVGAVLIGGLTPASASPGGRDRGNLIPWSEAQGHPSIGDRPGIYIWHEGDTVNIVSQSEHHKTAAMKVTVRNGRIEDVRRIHDEHNDTVIFPKNNVVEFKSRTDDGRDEIKFHVGGGNALVFNVRQSNERDRPVYVGGHNVRYDRGNLAFNLNR